MVHEVSSSAWLDYDYLATPRVRSSRERLYERRSHLVAMTDVDRERYQGAVFPRYEPRMDEEARAVHFNPDFKHVALFRVADNRENSALFDLREIENPNSWYQLYAPFMIEEDAEWSATMCNGAWLMLCGDGEAMRIHKIENFSDYRLGSALIQFTIEKSIEAGFGGKVVLCSKEESSLFYYKLGFDCRDPAVQRKVEQAYLNNGGSPDGFEMYLGPEAIEAWKEKIRERPIFLKDGV